MIYLIGEKNIISVFPFHALFYSEIKLKSELQSTSSSYNKKHQTQLPKALNKTKKPTSVTIDNQTLSSIDWKLKILTNIYKK